MKKLVLFYSYSGNTAKHAQEFAAANDAELIEVKSEGKLGKLKAYSVGCLKAMKGSGMPIQPLGAKLTEFTEADIFAPIWAGSIAPPMNTALAALQKGTKVTLHLVSGSGKSNKERNTATVKALGLDVVGYVDMKGA